MPSDPKAGVYDIDAMQRVAAAREAGDPSAAGWHTGGCSALDLCTCLFCACIWQLAMPVSSSHNLRQSTWVYS